jgi:Cft2 family RNA processing exonuclease
MGHADLKIYLFNGATMVISMTAIEPALKIMLLLVSIGYTVNRWITLYTDKKNNNETKD